MSYRSDAITKMKRCQDLLTGHFRANEWLKPYSQKSGQEYLKCSECKWACSCIVCKKVVAELQ